MRTEAPKTHGNVEAITDQVTELLTRDQLER